MEHATLTLTDFLLARIAEDEAAARGHWQQDEWRVRREQGYPEGRYSVGPVREDDGGLSEAEAAYFARWQPARVLAECEAKRRIVELHAVDCYVGAGPDGDDDYFCSGCHASGGPHPDDVRCPTLTALATPYTEHPDYRSEWKP